MYRAEIRERLGWLIGSSIFLVTVVVTPITTLDPINVPKMWILAALAVATFAVLLTQPKELFTNKNLKVFLPAGAFLLFMLVALLISNTSKTQQLYGVYGRNTGLLTYLCFAILFFATAIGVDERAKNPILISAIAALGLNATYGFIQAIGKDPQEWSNPYSPVIGTFGNPNFVAAFLGMGSAFALSYLVAKKVQIKYKVLAVIYLVIAIFDILKSDAQQGIIISLLSLNLVGYYFIKFKIRNLTVRIIYLISSIIVYGFAIFGTLQKGPFSDLLYKPSVTYRGDYWNAGWNMFLSNPLFGVGLDSYGDFYRSTRSLEATLRRGPSTVSNAAHNVFIDFAATAGIFTLIAYLALLFMGLRAAWRISKRSKDFNPFFVSVFVAWIGYLVQSTISINNIAIAIWGWVLPGLLIAMERWKKEDLQKKVKLKKADYGSMTMVMGFVAGAVIGFFPFNADANFRHELEAGNQNQIYNAALKWPSDPARMLYAAQIFDQNKMPEKSVELARAAVNLSPRNFDAIYLLYNSPLVDSSEKKVLAEKLIKIDPHNPDLVNIK